MEMHAVSSSKVYMKIYSESPGEKLYGAVVDGRDQYTLHKGMSLSSNENNNVTKMYAFQVAVVVDC